MKEQKGLFPESAFGHYFANQLLVLLDILGLSKSSPTKSESTLSFIYLKLLVLISSLMVTYVPWEVGKGLILRANARN